MEAKKRPDPVCKREPGKKQMRQKYFQHSHSIKPKRKIPPNYDRKFDREILKRFTEKYRGSLVGQIASQRLQDLPGQRKCAS